MRTRFAYLSALFLLFVGQVVFAQVTGTVEDADGFPLSDAQVTVRGSDASTVTDENGAFSIDAQIGDVLIITDLMGVAQEFNVSKEKLSTLKFGAPVALTEVTLVGGIKMDASQKVGAYTTVSKEDFELAPVASIDEVLNGRVAGLVFSTNGGQPGSTNIIAIRGVGSLLGTTNPLYVIDGVIVGKGQDSAGIMESYNPLASIDPNAIENVTVLRDASATALYGARGANGVIVVTTKKGKYNQSTRFNVSTDMAIQDVAYDKQDWMNAEEFVKWGTLLYYNAPSGGGEPGWGASGLTMDEARQAFIDFSGWDGQTDTDWFDAVQRNVSSVKTYNVSATGGSENTSFRVGFSYYDNNPLIITSKFDRISLNSAINHKIGDKFNMGLNLNYSNVTNKTYDDGGAYRNPWLNNWMLNPLVPIYDESDPTGYNMNNLGPGSSAGFNPVAIQKNDIMQGNIDTFVGSINAELQFAPGFYLYSLFGTQYQFLDEKQYWHNWLGDGLTYGGYLAKTHTQTFDWNWNSSVSYRKVLAEKHDIQIFVGMEYQEHWYDYFQAEAQQMLEDEPYLYWGTTDQEFLLRPYADYTEWKQLSYFSRLNYVFDGKYTLSGQLRRDGNSTLGNEKFGTFWSVAGAWDLDSENFIPETFNNLVLRANYGQIGNIPYADNYRAVYNNFTTVGIGTYGNDVTLGIAGFGDPNLIWEEAQQLNVGLDASFLNDNIGFSIDYYDKKTESLIFTGRIPTSTYGGGAITSNVGELLNKGIEFSINAKPYNKEFKWIINGNLSYNKGMVGDMYDPEEIQTGNELSFKGIKQGQMIGEYYLLGWAGVNPETGAPRWYTDETETETTEVLSEASPYFQGTSPFPKYIAGLRNEFIYKGVSLSVFFSGQFEYQVLNAWSHYVYNDGAYAYFNQTIGALEDSWSPDNPNASNPLQWNGNSSGSRAHSSRWLRDGDHIRLKEAKLAYSFGNRFKSQTGVDNLTIYVKGMNLWMYAFDEDLTFDPESNSNGRGSGFWGKGIYDYTSPLMRSVSLGVSIDF